MDTKPISILVIDGDSASRNYLAAMLGKNGYMVLSASSGREGMISAWRDQPDMIVLDPVLSDLSGLELITRLRQDHRTSKVPCVALSSRENPQEMTALLNAGCNEYLVKSSQALQKLLELIPQALGTNIEQIPVKKGKLIAFLSAKGGTGTSSLCANIAMCLASQMMDKKVAVIDLVLPIGSIADIVGYRDPINLVTAAKQTPDQTTAAYFADNLPRVSGWYFHLLAGAPDPESANQLSGNRVGEILKAIMESYDFIFVDLGRSLSRISMPIIQQAEVIALVLSTDLATADLTLTIWQYLQAQGVDSQRIYAIQNRAVGLEGMTKAELEKKVGLLIRVTMPYMGDNFTVANNRHEAVSARFPDDSVAVLLRQIASELIEVGKKRNR
jgi:MinD-like ATPase involved in chromosome partitioning or flagellar assembly/CheY-like chemotaxis protein